MLTKQKITTTKTAEGFDNEKSDAIFSVNLSLSSVNDWFVVTSFACCFVVSSILFSTSAMVCFSWVTSSFLLLI